MKMLQKLLVLGFFLAIIGYSVTFADQASSWDYYWHPIDGKEASGILVPGKPPLTVGLQNVLLNCVEFGFSIALTEAEKEGLRSALMQEYLNYKGQLISDLMTIENLWREIFSKRDSDRAKFRQIIRDSLVEEVGKNPDFGLGKAIGDIQKNAGQIVFSGTAKIDHRSLSAFIEILQLGLKLRERRVLSWKKEDVSVLESAILERIPRLSPEGRKWLSNADYHRTLIFHGWDMMAQDEKPVVKNLLIAAFAPYPIDPNSPFPVDLEKIELPPPNLFPLPKNLPWDWR